MELFKKVCKGLECCTADLMEYHKDHFCDMCPYKSTDQHITYCFNKRDLMADALSLLKAQKPRVMTLEEVEGALDTVVWVDRPNLENTSDEYALITAYSMKHGYFDLRYTFCDPNYRERSDYATYGKRWRCWTQRPTDEQRKAVEWE